MPKMKTHRGAAKRFKVTGSGRVKCRRANKSHMMTGKPAKRTRKLRQTNMVPKVLEKSIKKLLNA